MNPFVNNILITFLLLIYVFGTVFLMDLAVSKGFPQDLSRKVVHIAAGSWLLFWPLYNQSHWTMYLNITPAFIWTILLLIKGFTAGPDDKAVKTMTRSGDRKELLRGPLYFTIIMNLAGIFFFGKVEAIIAMGFLTWGDGLAPITGSWYGKHSYNIFSRKTVEGSITFFIAGILGTLLFSLGLGLSINFLFVIICGIVLTIVEGISPKDFDNILIPITTVLLFYLFY